MDDRLHSCETGGMSNGEHHLVGPGRGDAADSGIVATPSDSRVPKNARLEWILALSTFLAAGTMVRFGIGALVPGYLVISPAILVAFQRGFSSRIVASGFGVAVALCLSLRGALLVGWVD